jgi:hypothetical protein
MRSGAAQWSLAFGASVLAHLAVAAVLALTLAPDPVPRAQGPQSRLDLSSDPIEQVAARPRDAAGDPVAEGQAEAPSLPAGVVPAGRAAPAEATTERLAPAAAPSTPLAGRAAAAPALPAAPPPGVTAAGAVPAPGESLAAAAPAADPVAADATPPATPVTSTQPEARPAPSAAPDAQRMAAAEAMPHPVAAADPAAQAVSPAAPAPAAASAIALPRDESLAAAAPPAESAPSAPLPATAGQPAELPAAERLATAPADAAALASAAPDATVAQLAVPAAQRLGTAEAPAAPVPSAMPELDRLATAPPTAERLATAATEPTALAAASPELAPASAAAPTPERLASAAAEATPTPPAAPAIDRLASATPPAAPLAAAVTDAAPAAAATPETDRLTVTEAEAPPLPAARPDAPGAPAAAPAAERLASAASDAPPLPAAAPEGLAQLAPAPPAPDSVAVRPLHDFTLIAAAAPATGERAQAALAWTGEGEGPIDPVSLAAIQSFMQPADLARLAPGEDAVRDGISALLASVPCARMQTVFLPETGALELRGHIPEDGLREPVLAALRGQVGGAIPVTDNLRVLPRPQCDVLTGIAALGLPQSTVQETDPRLVGPDAHAREYHYREGDRLSFEVTTPDYPAHVYIDYFDAEGMVLHLQPNELLDTQQMEPKSTLAAGIDPTTGESVFDITVAPPFGNEIAVAFAASTPIHDAPRPVREPAGPYLDWLRTRIAEAREADPDFRGEWVYFFMSTAPSTD